jgi:hypothetical protein
MAMSTMTEDQVRDAFLDEVWRSIGRHAAGDQALEEKLRRLAFDLLCLLDGAVVGFPRFLVAPDPHPDDKAFAESRGEAAWPENHSVTVAAPISGELHERFFDRKPGA